jgi:hypothetical protein
MAEKSKPQKFPMKLLMFGFVLVALNFVFLNSFGRDIKLYPEWAKVTFAISNLAMILVAFFFILLLMEHRKQINKLEKK